MAVIGLDDANIEYLRRYKYIHVATFYLNRSVRLYDFCPSSIKE